MSAMYLSPPTPRPPVSRPWTQVESKIILKAELVRVSASHVHLYNHELTKAARRKG